MGLPWNHIFPAHVSSTIQTVESWIASIFFFLFLLTIGPWFLFLLYDVFLYLFRTTTYEVPIIGGRARGKERPRAPTLTERPTGDPRVLGIGVPGATFADDEDLRLQTMLDKDVDPDSRPVSPQKLVENDDNCEKGRQFRSNSNGWSFSSGSEEGSDHGSPTNRKRGLSTSERSWTEVRARRRMGFHTNGESGS